MSKRSSLSRKRNYIKSTVHHSKMVLLLIAAAMSASCGSSKPKVITTKAESIEYQASTTPVSRPLARNRKPERAPEPLVDPEENEIEKEVVAIAESLSTVDAAILYAKEFEGTRYRYGGSTKKGMDCSGLINVSFDLAGEQVPRTSMSLFQATQAIETQDVKKGDLMFFATGRDRKKINHVALVVEVTPAEIRFIHATVSQGVTISSFNEPYWLGRYMSSGRLL